MVAQEAGDIRTRVLLAGILAGLMLTIAGLAWPLWAKPSLVWSPEQAAEYQAAGDALHAARRINPDAAEGGANAGAEAGDGAPDAPLIAAQQRFDKIESELVAAQSLREGAGAWLRWLGLAVMLLCGLGYLASRGD